MLSMIKEARLYLLAAVLVLMVGTVIVPAQSGKSNTAARRTITLNVIARAPEGRLVTKEDFDLYDGGVSQEMLKDYWPQIEPHENPVAYVTNGVHVPTFLAPEWCTVLERYLGVGWMHRLGHPGIWEKIRDIPDHIFWSVRQDIKARLLHMLRYRVALQHTRNHGSESHLERVLRYADPAKPNVLTIGFGRRFATYKRATLLFNDLDNVRRILGDKERAQSTAAVRNRKGENVVMELPALIDRLRAEVASRSRTAE